MDLHCLQSPAVSSIPRTGLLERPYLCGRTSIKFAKNKRNFQHCRKLRILDCRAQVSATTTASLEAPSANTQKDRNLVFVAGATGRVGSRTVRELIKLGFKVRAGVRSIQRAESLVQSVKNMKLEDAAEGTQPIDKLELVECDLERKDQIEPALSSASVVICCIGASEKEVFDVTGPYRIDYLATKNLIDAAASAKVDQFILVTSLGTNKFGFPAAILNLFWGVLCWKRKAEEALLASGLPYTIVRPGGMERPTDAFKETHNITVSEEDTLFGGLVSNLQVAELLAFMAQNRDLSCCKIVEVIAETTAPLTPMGELLKRIPSGRICPPMVSDVVSEPKVAVLESIASEIPSPFAEKEPMPVKPTATRPLSPYTAYEDLKPPTSPSPTPSSGFKASKAETIPAVTDATPQTIQINSSETSSEVIKDEALQVEQKKIHYSSPYINYEDLKPPTSPTPNPPNGPIQLANTVESVSMPTASDSGADTTQIEAKDISDVKPATAAKQIARPSSPYTAYEDLKPPSSPTPTPSGPKVEPPAASTSAGIASQITEGNDAANSTNASDIVFDNSPYQAYEDLKPPSSPSPGVPSPPKEDKPNLDHQTELKPRPLSPYTMYEDLKPPSSPSPSPSKI